MSTTVITSGDINGIGPEIVIKAINRINPSIRKKIILTISKRIFQNTSEIVKPEFEYKIVDSLDKVPLSPVTIIDLGNAAQSYSKATRTSGMMSFRSIIKGIEIIKKGYADSLVTAPISKDAFEKAGVSFPGHTELLADAFGTKNFAMMFVSEKMKAALVTIHIPINAVSTKLSREKVRSVLRVIIDSLVNDFNISVPKVSILGLNPHSGEKGRIGHEETEIIAPAVKEFHKFVRGPLVADAYFGNKLFRNFDCTVGIYHDQILIPFKLLNFNRGVNFTAGLPIVRTSPDHGTAYDIAGEGIADPGSLVEAFKFALKIQKNRRANFGDR
jgi:4-hydroxythreonine-4-phosphate dehydrogenase